MMRALTAPLRWFVFAVVAVAIWQAYNGDPAAIANAIWGWIQTGATLLTQFWNEINK